MPVQLLFKNDVRDKMKIGVDKLADAVKVTLGPMGRNVSIYNEREGKPKLTKDGVTVARSITLEDKYEDTGAQLVKEAATKTAFLAGDGTTTSTVLAQVIISEGMKALEKGANPVSIKRGMDNAVALVIGSLKEQSTPVTSDKLISIATISANNDEEIGKTVAGALNKVGEDGVVYLTASKTPVTHVEFVEGLQLDRGYISQHFVNNLSKMIVDFADAYILLYDRKISTFKDIEGVLNIAVNAKRPLLIIAEDVDAEALATLVTNKTRGGLPFAAIKLPGMGNMQMQILEDIAVITGATVINEQAGHVLQNTTANQLGQAKQIVISAISTKIIGGKGNKKLIEERITQVKALMESLGNEFEADKMKKQRLAKLSNGVGIIHVGAATDVEIGEKMDRFDDAVCATKAAMAEGVVPGGGTAYIRALSALPECYTDKDENIGLGLIKLALCAPLSQMCINAGRVDHERVINAVILNKEGNSANGYNVKEDKFENLLSTGIIDPTKVARVALQHASSVAAMFLTTECAIIPVDPHK